MCVLVCVFACVCETKERGRERYLKVNIMETICNRVCGNNVYDAVYVFRDASHV